MPVSQTSARELAARKVRAARGWAGISQPELARDLEISVASVRRIEQHQRDVTTAELIRIGEICDVPRDFMLYGWRPEGKTTAQHRADSLETIIEDMARRVERHERLHALYHEQFDVAVIDESHTRLIETKTPDLHAELDASVRPKRVRKQVSR